ncbi:hypothetical protein [Leifsonia sp. NPDC058230]|uniref:hypothetical protein n=1 Tax=Leifsonia sp. NPDC058230 TaxID=3346391 RepID=UPI0036DDD242
MAKSLDELKNQVADRQRDVEAAGAAVIQGARKREEGLGSEMASFLRDQARAAVVGMGTEAPSPNNVRILHAETLRSGSSSHRKFFCGVSRIALALFESTVVARANYQPDVALIRHIWSIVGPRRNVDLRAVRERF